MANNIVYDYAAIESAAEAIEAIATNYKNLGERFNVSFTSAISPWEGESKDKVQALINKDVNTLLTEQVPSFVKALATLLTENVKQMKNADTQIAGSIPDGLK